MDTFQLEFITPESRYFSGQVHMVEVPGVMGDFGVLAGHAPFISTIRPGVITIHSDESSENATAAGGGRASKVFVAGGIAEVNQTGCTVLAEQVIDISNFSVMEAQDRLNKAREKLEHTFETLDKADAEAEFRIAEAILSAVS